MLPFTDPQPGLAEAARSLDRHDVAPELRSRFVEYAANAPLAALWHAKPRYLAEQLLSSERATLRMLLAGVHEGVVGATFALTDNGDSIFLVGGQMSTFGGVITGGHEPEVTTADVVFWPKEDDPWKSTKGAPAGPSSNDLIWNAMPKGKSEIIARKAMALTLLGEDLFFVQAEGDQRFLKAIALPQTQASSPTGESRRSQNTR
jgi:hypothetical protein